MGIAETCEGRQWDVLVVGAGMGGAAAAWALARAGWSVLVVERGPDHRANPAAIRGRMLAEPLPGEDASALAEGGRDPDPLLLDDGRHRFLHHPFLGTGSGGSSALYGTALERFHAEDLEPRACHRDGDLSELPESWPFPLSELQPWYSIAENRLGVVGGEPLYPDQLAALSPANANLAARLLARGLPMTRLRIGDQDDGSRGVTQGMLCPHGRKNDAARAFLHPAQDIHGAVLLDRCRVLGLDLGGRGVDAVVAERAGQRLRLRARTVIIAAGALRTPALLLDAGVRMRTDRSGWVGRGLMRHFVDLHALRVGRGLGPSAGKELACDRWYCADGLKLGTVQSFGPLPPPATLVQSLRVAAIEERRRLPAAALAIGRPLVELALARVFDGCVLLASIVEDLPYRDNRVELGVDGTITVRYHLHPEAIRRIAAMRALLAKAFAGLPVRLIPAAEDLRRLAHACGTCRAGDDPTASVVDRWCRCHGLDNLHIVDSSWMPSSGGTNPGLTIAANALRVAAHLIGEAS